MASPDPSTPSSATPAKPTRDALELHPFEAAERQRVRLIRVVRVIFLVLIVAFSLLAFLRAGQDPATQDVAQYWVLPVVIGFALFALGFGVDLLTPRKKISTITGVLVGVLAGMIATLAIGFVVDLVIQSWVTEVKALEVLAPTIKAVKVLIGITLSYLGVTTVLQTQDDFRLVIPYVEFSKQLRGTRAMLLDSSALIDGRLVDLANTNILQAPVVIPRFVITELQQLADSEDPNKRARGRRGLDIVAKLQRATRLDITIDETAATGKGVDAMLVDMGRTMNAVIVTTDTGLARVATINNVPIINLHDVAIALRPTTAAGETLRLKLVKPGENPNQAVGFLADGTVVVAENGRPLIGREADLTITSVLQTSNGRMLFARVIGLEEPPAPPAPTPAPAPEPTTKPIAEPTAKPISQSAPSTEAPTQPTNQPTNQPTETSPIAPVATPTPPQPPAKPAATAAPKQQPNPKPFRSVRAGNTARNPRRG